MLFPLRLQEAKSISSIAFSDAVQLTSIQTPDLRSAIRKHTMGEVANMADYAGGSGSFDDRVLEWEAGLPGADDLTPLSQALIPWQLANAFNIKPETSRSKLDVDRASRETFSSLRGGKQPAFAEKSFKPYDEMNDSRDLIMIEEDDGDGDGGDRFDSRKIRRIEAMEEADSASRGEYSNSIDDQAARALKRPRLVWTPQLHKRFVDVVTHLGIKSAVPKTIMQLMNVEGLTRENVASHLQKYRLYLKRNQGPNYEGPSSSDQLFASTPPASQNLHQMQGGARNGHGNGHVAMPIPYGPGMVAMPMFGNSHGHMYGMMQQRDWSGNSNGSVVSYPHAVATDK